MVTHIPLASSHAGISAPPEKKPLNSSYTVFATSTGDHSVDDPSISFSSAFTSSLATAAVGEDIAVTVRRAKAGMEGPRRASPTVIDRLDKALSIIGTEGRKRALLIAAWEYEGTPLRAPLQEATKLERVLKAIGFETSLLLNPSWDSLDRSVRDFASTLARGDQVVFYFSGDGFDSDGEPNLLPITKTCSDVAQKVEPSIPFQWVHDQIAGKVPHAVFVVEAGRVEQTR